MDYGENTIYEDRDGTIEIAGPNGFVRIPAAYRKSVAIRLNQRPPRQKCSNCGNESNFFICRTCQDILAEKSAPQFSWDVFHNGKSVKRGKSSKAKACTEYTKYAGSKGATNWDRKQNCYFDDKGQRYFLSFKNEIIAVAVPKKVAPIFAGQ